MFKRKINVLFIVILLCLTVFAFNVSAEEITAEAPVITTTCGQSPGALMVSQICKMVKINCEQKDLLTADYLKEKEFNTVIITMGTSGKGMGAAGTDMKAEVDRINAIIEEAKNQGMTVIGAHIEGEARRVDENDAKSIEVVAPKSDILIARKDSNKDNYFTDLGKKAGMPVYIIEKTLDLTQPLKEIFQLSE